VGRAHGCVGADICRAQTTIKYGQQLDGIIQLGVVDVEIRKVLSSQK
jgi:hypothetical protein